MTNDELLRKLAAMKPVTYVERIGLRCFFCGSDEPGRDELGGLTHKHDCIWGWAKLVVDSRNELLGGASR